MKPSRLALLVLSTLIPATLHAVTPEEQAVLTSVQALFNGMAARDAAAIKAALLPGGTILYLREGKPTQVSFEDFANRIGKPAPTHIEEKIHDPLIRIDNDLAVVWAPYDFTIDGKVDHCGTDLFNLVRQDGKWLIATVAYSSRKDCQAK